MGLGLRTYGLNRKDSIASLKKEMLKKLRMFEIKVLDFPTQQILDIRSSKYENLFFWTAATLSGGGDRCHQIWYEA